MTIASTLSTSYLLNHLCVRACQYVCVCVYTRTRPRAPGRTRIHNSLLHVRARATAVAAWVRVMARAAGEGRRGRARHCLTADCLNVLPTSISTLVDSPAPLWRMRIEGLPRRFLDSLLACGRGVQPRQPGAVRAPGQRRQAAHARREDCPPWRLCRRGTQPRGP